MEADTTGKKGSFFTRHLECAGERYGEHLLFTLKIGGLMLVAGTVVVIHGLLPFILETAGSDRIAHINKLLCERRARQKPAA